MASIQTAPKTAKLTDKKKSSMGSSSSMSSEPFLRDTTHLFSLDPNDYYESVCVMIEFIANHPLSTPLTKIQDPPTPLCLLHATFEQIKIDKDVHETKITGDRIMRVHESTFLKAIGVKENLENFKVQEPTAKEF